MLFTTALLKTEVSIKFVWLKVYCSQPHRPPRFRAPKGYPSPLEVYGHAFLLLKRIYIYESVGQDDALLHTNCGLYDCIQINLQTNLNYLN